MRNISIRSTPKQHRNNRRQLEAAARAASMNDLYGMPGHLIRRAHQISTAVFAEECAAFDLTSVQYAALVALRNNSGIDATRLSTLVAFDRSTLGDVLERLEGKGWIERGPSATDRRVKLLSLSAAGVAKLRQVGPAVRRVQQRLLEPLSPADRATMVRLLAQLAAVHNDLTPAPLRADDPRRRAIEKGRDHAAG